MTNRITVHRNQQELWIDLPPRCSERLRRYGWGAAAFGVVTFVFNLLMCQPKVLVLALLPSIAIFYFGTCLVRNKTRSRLRWSHNSLDRIENVGWLFWTRSCNASRVTKFACSSILTEKTTAIAFVLPKQVENLVLQLKGQNELFHLVCWYPRPVLEQVCKVLVPAFEEKFQRTELLDPPQNTIIDELALGEPSSGDTSFDAVDESDEEAESAIRERRPDGSQVGFEYHSHAIVFLVPPKGFWKGSGDIAKICTVVLLVTGYGTLGFFGSVFAGKANWLQLFYAIPVWCSVALFWAYCYSKGRAAVTIGASRDSVWLDQTFGVTKNRIFEFERSELKEITSYLGVVSLNREIHQIQTTLGDDELRWIAAELSRYVGLDSSSEQVIAEMHNE